MVSEPDTGLANERTLLGWQRTALSIVVAAVVLGRLTIGRLGVVAAVLVAAAGLVALWVSVESRWRYAQQRGERSRQRPRRGGRATLSLSVATSLLVLCEALALLRG
ncbi:hypothetical protein GCM10022237_36620 [Nocardioides ginsengisoli]